MATVHLDDPVGDDPDFDKEFCEHCGEPIIGNDAHHDVFTYDILCEQCYADMVEDERYAWPPADSDV